MGRGGALLNDDQVPRLTSVLRAAIGQPVIDADAQALARKRALEARQSQGAAGLVTEIGGVGKSKLPQLLFGSWDKAPKPAREQYTRFLQAVQQLLASEVPSAELHDAALVVWNTLDGLPPPETARGRGPQQLLLGPQREALTRALGPSLDLSAVQAVVTAVQALRVWQNQLGITASSTSSGSASTLAGGSGGGGSYGGGGGVTNSQVQNANSMSSSSGGGYKAAGSSQQGEWGASLEWHEPHALHATSSSGQHVVLACQWPLGPLPLAGAMIATGQVQSGYRGGGGFGPSPQELLAMAMSGMGNGTNSHQPQQQGAMFAAAAGTAGARIAEDEDDLGEEYEDGKRAKEVNLHWLQRWAEAVTGDKGAAAASIAESTALLLLLHATSGGEAVAEGLTDLLGYEAAERISQLLEKRKQLLGALQLALAKVRAEEDEAADRDAMPVYGTQVTITSTSAKARAKQERKDARKGRTSKAGAAGDADVELLQEVGWEAVLDTEKDHSATLVLGPGMEFKIGGEGATNRKALPAGTVRKSYKGYEEVRVPAPTAAPPPAPDELVTITQLDEWAQPAFAGFKSLNRIQSRIFKTAYHSSENILVCAPTGAGKTNIAMLTVLRTVGENIRHGIIQRADFKIVYVAPMKALAAEVTAAFSRRLQPLGLTVRELTGDMQLSKRELAETQMIVTTPEKWDVITRKGGDVSIASLVRLLIIDEVHLLNDDRGPVIETLVARTQRQVESSQALIRVVGLSATLPNYQDVALFLNVNLQTGLFYFDASFRPVPLQMSFVGVSETNHIARNNLMTEICFNKVHDSLKRGYQVMVFVHSRKDTGKTARALADWALKTPDALALFDTRENPKHALAKKDVGKSRNRELAELFDQGFGIHHAGMLRPDRSLTERLFSDGLIKVLCCTATLAWGVNLPAHTVIIKGTQVYDAQKGTFTDLGMLDVQQIFGRAGRPQFDTSGEACIITSHAKLAHYLGMLTHQVPIESQFKSMLVDNLNAEIVLGSVTNVREAAAWLGYTYLHTRMSKNPLAYGLTYQDVAMDPSLETFKRDLIVTAAKELKKAQMANFDERSGNLYTTELGRVASHYYIRHQSIVTFNELLREHMTEAQVLNMIAQSSEFESMMVREEELTELDDLVRSACPHDVKGIENKHGKANVLMQAYVSRSRVDSFSLTADMMYVSSNAPRILRAIFEICLRRKWSSMVETSLTLCKCVERRLWWDAHPLRQFEHSLEPELLSKLEDRHLSLEQLQDMSAADIGAAVRHPAKGAVIKGCVDAFPSLHMDAQLHPITRTVLRIQLTITPTFTWRDKAHGAALRWLILVEDSENEHIYHSESWLLTKKMAMEGEQRLAFTIPIFEPLPSQYFVRAVSDDWLHAEALLPLSFAGLILPERMPPHTELLDLDPLPLSALNNPTFEAMYQGRFTHFNPIQTQAFHTLYHTDEPVLLGAPTGSGKTVSSELTMLRLFNNHPDMKVIYIAPLKALVRERINDWTKGLCRQLGKTMVELTGDYTPDLRALLAADIIIATPEKWDGISRNWQARAYVKKVGLVVIDEIHLLGADRGPVLEVIVSRMRYIAARTGRPVRFVGLSTALANAQDLADWLGVGHAGLFNFKPSVRPVPLEAHIQGYPGKFYCPRMAAMNKPCYAAIQMHSPDQPVLVFVSSRRQTRLTAMDLIQYAVADMRPQQWLHMPEDELEMLLMGVKDAALKHTLQFGIGLHHAGLNDRDRTLVEQLFVEQKIQVLVATSTLAWGVNTPTHLVIIKGTEFYDAPTKRYVDFPITDVLQMMGRAGRPQYDHHGVAVIMVHEPKKQFYKRFLYEPFPVESSLAGQLADHLNAEVVAGTISSKQDALDYLTWTYFFRRLVQNPSYYDLEDTTADAINTFLSELIEGCLQELQEAGCVELGEDSVAPTMTGRVAAFYYLQHTTMSMFTRDVLPDMQLPQVLQVMCSVAEFDELPVRHNEDKLNAVMAREVRYPLDTRFSDDPHMKAQLLLQAHLSRAALPISDYVTDTKSVLDNSLRILQAMVDVASDAGWLGTTLAVINTIQSIMQARWVDEDPLLTLPHMDMPTIEHLREALQISSLPQLVESLLGPHTAAASHTALPQHAGSKQAGVSAGVSREAVLDALSSWLGESKARDVAQVCERLPVVSVTPLPARLKQLASVGDSQPQHAEDEEDAEAGVHGDEHVEVPQQPGQFTWQLDVQLSRLRPSQGTTGKQKGAAGNNATSRPRVYAPRFPKVKEEGWYLVAGDPHTHELYALRRCAIDGVGARPTHVRLTLPTHNGAGHPLHRVTLYLLSDSYLGLDQQMAAHLGKQTAGPQGAQLHGEGWVAIKEEQDSGQAVPRHHAAARPQLGVGGPGVVAASSPAVARHGDGQEAGHGRVFPALPDELFEDDEPNCS